MQPVDPDPRTSSPRRARACRAVRLLFVLIVLALVGAAPLTSTSTAEAGSHLTGTIHGTQHDVAPSGSDTPEPEPEPAPRDGGGSEQDPTAPAPTRDDGTDTGPAEEEADPTPRFPSEPPPGFTEDQFRRFVNVVQACGFDSGWVCDTIFDLTGNQTAAETAQWIYDVPLRLAVIFLAAFAINRLVHRLISRFAARVSARSSAERDIDPDSIKRGELRVHTATSAIGGAATVVIFIIAGLIALGELGITLGPLLAGAGIAGIALGFGAQNMVRDVLAGLFVVFEDHYGVGDIIDAGRATGVVEDVSLRITKVRDIEGTLWFIPNGIIEGVGNRTQLWARAIIDFDIDYRADHERAGEIIKATADQVWQDADAPVRILEEPALWGVESLGDSSVVIRLAVKCAPAEQWSLARLLRGQVKKALDAEGIEIPFPQHTVWVHGVPEGETPPDDEIVAGAAVR